MRNIKTKLISWIEDGLLTRTSKGEVRQKKRENCNGRRAYHGYDLKLKRESYI